MKDYYSILEIHQNAGEKLIKSQYRKLATLYHPDKNPENVNKFIDLNEAYRTLMNPDSRQLYDLDLKEEGDFKKKQSENKAASYRTRLRDGGNINIEIDFNDDFVNRLKGTEEEDGPAIEKTVSLQRYVKCPDCGGQGREKGTLVSVCPQCKGLGKVKSRDTGVDKICRNCNGYGDIFLYKCKTCGGMARIKKTEEIKLQFDIGELLVLRKTDSVRADNHFISFENNANRKFIVFKGKGDEGVFGGKNGDLTVLVKIDEDILNKKKRNNGFFTRLFSKRI